jgi:hypothetical protein
MEEKSGSGMNIPDHISKNIFFKIFKFFDADPEFL